MRLDAIGSKVEDVWRLWQLEERHDPVERAEAPASLLRRADGAGPGAGRSAADD